MSAPRTSVVIPCFNAERYIGATVRSVLAQDDADVEVIVVDDGSSDGSAALVADAFPNVRLLRQKNQGVAAARNAGIAAARGPWIAFLDADDIWLPGKLSLQHRALQGEPSCRMAYAAWHVWPSDDAEPGDLSRWTRPADDPAQFGGPSGWIYPELLLDCEVWTSTVLARRDLFDEIGGFDPSLRLGEDYDLWLRASRVTPILRVPRPLALYRSHGASITRTPPARNWRCQVVDAAVQRWGYATPDGARTARKKDVDHALARGWASHAGMHLQAGSLATARQGAWHSLRLEPLQLPAWKILGRAALRSMTGSKAA